MRIFVLIGILNFWVFKGVALADERISLSIAKLPVLAESVNKGVFVDLTKRMGRELSETVDYGVYPFVRSMKNVKFGRAVAHVPFIMYPGGEEDLAKSGLEYSYEHISTVGFALYFQSDNPVMRAWADSGFTKPPSKKIVIETENGHVPFFKGIHIRGTACLDCMVKRLSAGHIDGLIFAAREIDGIIAAQGAKGLDSVLYKALKFGALFKNDEKGRQMNRKISDILAKLKASGEFQSIMKPYTEYYLQRFPQLRASDF